MSARLARCSSQQQLCTPSTSSAAAVMPSACLRGSSSCRPAPRRGGVAVAAAAAFAAAAPNHLCRRRPRSSMLRVQAVAGTGGGMAPQLKTAIDSLIQNNKVVVFMKGTKDFPQCGFSNNVVRILSSLNAPFEAVNILENDALRGGMKEYSQWPTFPQVYIDGEFYGGCDIMIEAYQSGELQETLERVLNE